MSGNSIMKDGFPLAPQTASGASNDVFTSDELPALPYDLREHKRTLTIAAILVLLTDCALPVVLYFGLSAHNTVKLSVIFALMTIPAAWSFLDWAQRTWRLVQPSDEYRPLGTNSRWALDFYHINYTSTIPLVTLFIALGAAKQSLTLVSVPVPFLFAFVGLELFYAAIAYALQPRGGTPVRISSIPKGAPPRPAAYTLIEDMVAVTGRGGKRYRRALDARYRVSSAFRQMLAVVTLVWATLATATGATLLVLVGVASTGSTTTPTVFMEVVFALCWTLPWLVAGVGALWTISFVKSRLRDEKNQWRVGI